MSADMARRTIHLVVITLITGLLLVADAAIALGGLWMAMDPLLALPQAAYTAEMAADVMESAWQVVCWQLGFCLMTIAAFCHWTYLTNVNVRRLGGRGLDYSPEWAVRWFFLPLANCWKPYSAMKQLCRASKHPFALLDVSAGWVVHAWWAAWITSLLTGLLYWYAATKVTNHAQLMAFLLAEIAFDTVCAVAATLAVILVAQVCAWQINLTNTTRLRRGLGEA
jgi:hypothetical protein